jgi:death-on-curing protein
VTEYVTIDWLLGFHRELMAEQGQQSILMGDQGTAKLEAAIARPQASAFGEDAYPNLTRKAAALLQALAIAHPFTDGNKRAAAGAMLGFLGMNGADLGSADEGALYDLVIAVTTGELREVDEIAARISDLFSIEG